MATTRKKAAQPKAPETTTTTDKLLVCQAVHEHGTNQWGNVAKVVSRHPLFSGKALKTPALTAITSKALYVKCMEDAGLEITEESSSPGSAINLKLAQIYYMARVNEILSAIQEQEQKYRVLMTEIEELDDGTLSLNDTEASEDTPMKDQSPEPATATPASAAPEDGEDSTPAPEASGRRREGKRRMTDAPDTPRDRKRAREDSEPAEDDTPTGSRRGRGPSTEATRRFQSHIAIIHGQISQHKYGNIFHVPIKTSDAPDYYDVVLRPMDLRTIKQKVREGTISNTQEFQRDIYLMFCNAMMFNKPGTEVYQMAEEMMLESETQLNQFMASG